jgi:hypothetical protein
MSNVYMVFKVKDKSEGVTYHGRWKVGEKTSTRLYPDEVIKQELMKWISYVRFTSPPLSKMIIKWDPPASQPYMDTLLHRQFLAIDLVQTLSISPQEIFFSTFELRSMEAAIT